MSGNKPRVCLKYSNANGRVINSLATAGIYVRAEVKFRNVTCRVERNWLEYGGDFRRQIKAATDAIVNIARTPTLKG